MSEIYAQLYDGNPLSIPEAELDRLFVAPSTEVHSLERRLTRKAVTRKIGGTPALFSVVGVVRRVGGERVIAKDVTAEVAHLIMDGAKYLHLLPAAIRELREPKDKLAANIVEHINVLLSRDDDAIKAEMITMVQSLLEAEQARWRA